MKNEKEVIKMMNYVEEIISKRNELNWNEGYDSGYIQALKDVLDIKGDKK